MGREFDGVLGDGVDGKGREGVLIDFCVRRL